jgi:predicted CopG family antitoxin
MMNELNKIESFDSTKFVEYLSSIEKNAEVLFIEVETTNFPLMKIIKKKFVYHFSLPFGLYTTCNESVSTSEIINRMAQEKSDNLTINFSPFSSLSYSDAAKIAKKNKCVLSINTCHVLDTNRSIEKIIDGFNSTRKKHIKRYQNAGLVNVFQTKEPYYFEEYYKLYLDSVIRWGEKRTGYNKALIDNLHSVPGIRMWVAEYKGKVISAMICIYHNDHVFDWLASSIINDEYKKLYAPVAVQFEVICHASKTGLKYVNMGASVNLSGVSDFKDSWGASECETFSFNKQSALFKVSKKIINNIKKIRS